jgi:hypothetical protein
VTTTCPGRVRPRGSVVTSVLAALLLLSSACAVPERVVSLVAEPAATMASAARDGMAAAACDPTSGLTESTPFDSPTPTPRPTNTLLRDVLPAVSALPSASTIVIERGWAGMSTPSPQEATYTLARSGDAFRGTASFLMYIPTGRSSKREETHAVVVPVSSMEIVLRDLTSIRVSPGPYRPWIKWTDDYPRISLRVTFQGQDVRFFTSSQGAGNVPWGVEHNGQTFVAETEDIAIVFRRLDVCLLGNSYDRIVRQIAAEERWRRR